MKQDLSVIILSVELCYLNYYDNLILEISWLILGGDKIPPCSSINIRHTLYCSIFKLFMPIAMHDY